ncbi:MAG: hypothetical protein LCH63_16470 [Candidatus Melainabacteria bacterium]|nr:hypothetical protein [Candidatus Melainabacteria bacterium]
MAAERLDEPSLARYANDLGLSIVETEFPSQPFIVFAKTESLRASLAEIQRWSRKFVCDKGRLILLTDIELDDDEFKAIDCLVLLPDLPSRAEVIHGCVASSRSADVLLVLTDSTKSTNRRISDYAELRRSIKGIDLPAEYNDPS